MYISYRAIYSYMAHTTYSMNKLSSFFWPNTVINTYLKNVNYLNINKSLMLYINDNTTKTSKNTEKK